LGIGPNPQSPIPNPQSPIYLKVLFIIILYNYFIKLNNNLIIKIKPNKYIK